MYGRILSHTLAYAPCFEHADTVYLQERAANVLQLCLTHLATQACQHIPHKHSHSTHMVMLLRLVYLKLKHAYFNYDL